jgi:peptidoglycan hydrolase-like protein with peptidoglycan-binding domain
MLLPVQDKNSKMERNKKAIVGLVLTSLLAFSVVPYFNVKAQTCDPNALVPVRFGQRGAAVRNAQACLIEAGYDIPAGATGYYGSQTRNAVKEFYADWYGAWSGNSLGPRGVAELKSRLAAAPSQPSQPTQPTTGVSQEQLQQVVTLLSQGKTNEALALLLTLLGQQPTATTATPTQPTTAEGVLTVERNSDPVSGINLREGETQNVLGIRLRATQGDVTVQRIRVNWPTGMDAPHRVLSRVELVDQSGNVLWSANVTSNEGQPFYRETSGAYYLLVTGLNLNVPKDTVKVVYLRATAVSTYPSSAAGQTFQLEVPLGGVRAVTAGGAVNLFEPQQTPVQNSFLTQTTLAGSAALSVVRTSDTPEERNVVANELVTGTGTAAIMRLTQDVPLLKIRLTAQNDTLRLREVVATFTASGFAGSGGPTQFYLQIDGRKVGNVTVNAPTTTISDLFPENISIPAGSSKEAILGVSRFEGVDYDGAHLTVSVVSVTAENSLGSTVSFSGSVTSEPVHFFAVAPTFAFPSSDNRVTAVRDQNNNTTTLNFTGKIVVSVPSNVHAGGQVRISSSSPFDLQWELSNTTTPTTTNYSISSVRDANGNVVSQTGGYYVLNAGDTYSFELTAQIQLSGVPQGRVRVNYIKWTPGNGGSWSTEITSTYVSRDFVTGWSN